MLITEPFSQGPGYMTLFEITASIQSLTSEKSIGKAFAWTGEK
jgi:hypothetical protein